MNTAEKLHGTTIVLLRKGGETIVAGDGQVSLGNTVLKSKAKKVRKIENRGVIAGFAGSTADALTLFEKFELNFELSLFVLKFLVFLLNPPLLLLLFLNVTMIIIYIFVLTIHLSL